MQHIPKTKQPIDESQLQPEYFLQNIFSFFLFFCISFKQLNAHSAIIYIRAHALILNRKDKAFFLKQHLFVRKSSFLAKNHLIFGN